MEWTFERLRNLAKATGVEFVKATLVAPPETNPSWSDPLSFYLVGTLGGLRAALYDNNRRDGVCGAPFVRLSLGNFHVQEDLLKDTYEETVNAVKKLVGLDDVKKVVAGGGVDKLRNKLWQTLKEAVEGKGGKASAEWTSPSGELPGYGKYEGGYSNETVVPVKLSRNKAEFATVKVDLLNDDFATKAQEVLKLLKAQKEDRKKKRKNTPLYERLNELKVTPELEGGKVVSLVDQNGESLRTAELEELGLDPENLGSVEPHPEGADRGGYLPEVGGCQYDENANEWR